MFILIASLFTDNRLHRDFKTRTVVHKKINRNYMKGKGEKFKHSGSYVHTESISKQAFFWDLKSPAIG